MLGLPVYYTGSNEPSHAPKLEWPVKTFNLCASFYNYLIYAVPVIIDSLILLKNNNNTMLLIADRKQSKGCIKRRREVIRDNTARFEYGDSTILILQTGAPCGALR